MKKKQPDLNPLQKAIVELRQKLGFSQQELAGRLGIALMTVSRWERIRTPSGRGLKKLSDLAASAGLKELADRFQKAWDNDPESKVLEDWEQEELEADGFQVMKAEDLFDWSTALSSIAANRHLESIDRKFLKLLPMILEIHAELAGYAEDTPKYLHPTTKADFIIHNHKALEGFYANERTAK